MRRLTLAALVTLMMTSQQAPDFVPVGAFAGVKASASEDPHCYGWSLKLWRLDGRLVGLLDRHQGLCGDTPCRVLTNVSHDARTGRLAFSAFDLSFDGRLQASGVTGMLGDERVTLTRLDEPMDARHDTDVNAWCEFWRTVPRCQGVTELCRSLRR